MSFLVVSPSEGVLMSSEMVERIAMLSAIENALARREEVLELLAQSSDPEEAIGPLSDLLQITATQAEAVMDITLRNVTRARRERIHLELASLIEKIGN
jgi:DNA gyrase/topoisomerase IV subunit A